MVGTESRRDTVIPADLADELIAHGLHFATLEQVAVLLAVPTKQVPPIMQRLRAKGRFFSPTRGVYVPIPPEYRSWGAVPASHFIDPLMRHLSHPYYVGLLSAAEVYGAAHQRPQVFQVVSDVQVRSRAFGRVRIEFIKDGDVEGRATETVNTPTGTMRVSSPEVTIFDLVAAPRHGGGLSNASTVAGELLSDGRVRPEALLDVAQTYPVSVSQRVGWILDHVAGLVGVAIGTDELAGFAREHRREPVPLAASEPRAGRLDERWNILVNTDIDPDL